MKPYLLDKIDQQGRTTLVRIEALNDEAAFEVAENTLNTVSGLAEVRIYPYLGNVGRVSAVQRNVHDGSNESDGKTQ